MTFLARQSPCDLRGGLLGGHTHDVLTPSVSEKKVPVNQCLVSRVRYGFVARSAAIAGEESGRRVPKLDAETRLTCLSLGLLLQYAGGRPGLPLSPHGA